MTNPAPLPKSLAITLDGSSGPEEQAFLDIFTCRRCGHEWEDHSPLGAILPSKSRCQLADCACIRFVLPGEAV